MNKNSLLLFLNTRMRINYKTVFRCILKVSIDLSDLYMYLYFYGQLTKKYKENIFKIFKSIEIYELSNH